MKAKFFHLTGFLMAVAGGVLAVGDSMKEITALNPVLAHGWPLVLAGAMALDRFGKFMGWNPTVPPTS